MPQSKNKQEDKVAKYVVAGLAVVGLVIVAWIDANSMNEINNFVYGGLVGAILGADVVASWLKK